MRLNPIKSALQTAASIFLLQTLLCTVIKTLMELCYILFQTGKFRSGYSPGLAAVPEGFVLVGCEKGFALYESSAPVSKAPEVSVKELAATGKTAKYSVETGDWSASGACDVMLEVAYTGNCARLYENETLVDDSIFMGQDYPWIIGLKRFGVKKNSFVLEVDELKKDAPVYLEQWPDFSSDGIMKVSSIKARAYHEVTARI